MQGPAVTVRTVSSPFAFCAELRPPLRLLPQPHATRHPPACRVTSSPLLSSHINAHAPRSPRPHTPSRGVPTTAPRARGHSNPQPRTIVSHRTSTMLNGSSCVTPRRDQNRRRDLRDLGEPLLEHGVDLRDHRPAGACVDECPRRVALLARLPVSRHDVHLQSKK